MCLSQVSYTAVSLSLKTEMSWLYRINCFTLCHVSAFLVYSSSNDTNQSANRWSLSSGDLYFLKSTSFCCGGLLVALSIILHLLIFIFKSNHAVYFLMNGPLGYISYKKTNIYTFIDTKHLFNFIFKDKQVWHRSMWKVIV